MIYQKPAVTSAGGKQLPVAANFAPPPAEIAADDRKASEASAGLMGVDTPIRHGMPIDSGPYKKPEIFGVKVAPDLTKCMQNTGGICDRSTFKAAKRRPQAAQEL